MRKNTWSAFGILWAGQALSLLGTGMTRFAVLIWAYEQAGTVTSLALLGFFAAVTYIIASPIAGVLVDRWNRRTVMLLADLGAGAMTATLLLLNATGQLQLWHLYLAEGITGVCEAFQEPAFSAAVSLLVPREGLTRANGLLGLGKSAARILAPALAGVALRFAGLNGVMGFDLLTMSLALGSLFFLRVPVPPRSAAGLQAAGSFWHQLRFGFTYILQRPGLRDILLIFFLINLFGTLTYFAVHSPMILARTGGDEVALGLVRSVMGVGAIVGGILVSLWGHRWRKARTYLLGTLLSFSICDFLTATSTSVPGWAIAGFLSELSIPFIVSPYYALWQGGVPPDVQGRVFSARRLIAWFTNPISPIIAGTTADFVLEPAMRGGGALPAMFGGLVGTGPGSGMSLLMVFCGLFCLFVPVIGYLIPAIRNAETLLPDYQQAPEAEATP